MNTVCKITVDVSRELPRKGQRASGAGITQTARSVPMLLIQTVFVFLSFIGTMSSGKAWPGQQKAPPPQQEQSQAPQSPSSQLKKPQPSNAPSPSVHVVTVNFDYDFTKVPACSPKITTKNCIKQFDVYDISGGHQKLFSIPAPTGVSGVVKDITGKSPRLVFEPGPHIIAVTAESAAGAESEVTGSKITLVVPKQAPMPASSSR